MSSLLPNGKQHFDDNNGRPLVGGRVYYYIPNTSTPKNTWQDEAQTILNTNPIILDARGECTAWGFGRYRQVVRDQFGNLIWDKIVTDYTGVISEAIDSFKEELASPAYSDGGSTLIGHSYDESGVATTAAIELRNLRDSSLKIDEPAVEPNVYALAALRDQTDWEVVVDGSAYDRYSHSPRMDRDINGRLHLVFSRGLFHGFGGSTPSNPVDPQGEIWYRYSDDNGRTWSDEQFICRALPPDPINVIRTVFDCHIGVCPSGRLAVVVSDIPPPSAVWGVPTGSTKYRWFINDNRGDLLPNGDNAWQDKGVFFTAFNDYARVYSQRIKKIPVAHGGYRMGFADYRQINATPSYMIGMWYSDDEFETAPVEGAPIMYDDGASNETDFCCYSSQLWYAISRSNGRMAITENAGASWTKIADSSNYDRQLWETNGLVAPTLDVVFSGGTPYMLLGYSHRGAGPDGPRYLVASLADIRTLQTQAALGQLYTPWGINYFCGPTVSGPGGYNSGIHYDSGAMHYVDVTETTISPTTGYRLSDIRIVRCNSQPWFPIQGGFMVGSKTSRFTQYNVNEIQFQPTLAGTTTAGTPTYSVRLGFNVRQAVDARIVGQVAVTAYTGIDGGLIITGLPFANLNIGFNFPLQVEVLGGMAAGWTSTDKVVGLVVPAQNRIILYRKPYNGNITPLLVTDLGATFNFSFSGNYFCLNEGLA